GEWDLDPGLAHDGDGILYQGVRGAAEARAGHPRDRVDVHVELGPDEGVDEVEAAAHGGGVAGGPANRLIGFVGIEHTDRDAGTRAVFHVTTIPGAARSGPRMQKEPAPEGADSLFVPRTGFEPVLPP